MPEGKRRATARRNVEKAYEIYCRVQNRGKVPVGNELWEAIGKDLGIGPTIVKDIYYAFRGPIERTLLDV